jgi:hypothetical protein
MTKECKHCSAATLTIPFLLHADMIRYVRLSEIILNLLSLFVYDTICVKRAGMLLACKLTAGSLDYPNYRSGQIIARVVAGIG